MLIDAQCLRLTLAVLLGQALLPLSAPCAVVGPLQTISLDSPGIVIRGSHFASLRPDGLHFDRFDATILESTVLKAKVNPERARVTSGVSLFLASHAPLIRLHFAFDTHHTNRGSQFGIYRDGKFIREVAANAKTSEIVIDLEASPAAGRPTQHEVVLPSWSNPILQKIEIAAGGSLEAPPATKSPRIVFLGDSITHGTGQGSASYKTYPFIAARKLGMEGYNLAVGGGQISPPVAELLQHFGPVEVIWILVGYNNWQFGTHDAATISAEYEELLAVVRRHQPEAQIFCSTLTYTRKSQNEKTGVTVTAVRDAVAEVVNRRIAAGDARLHLVRGEQFTDDACLPASDDPVHFSPKGAARFAEAVVETVRRTPDPGD